MRPLQAHGHRGLGGHTPRLASESGPVPGVSGSGAGDHAYPMGGWWANSMIFTHEWSIFVVYLPEEGSKALFETAPALAKP
jgi:hypothetical protein